MTDGDYKDTSAPRPVDTPATHREAERGSANRDPLTGEPGADPVGTGVGAAGGAAAGAAVGGIVGGPVGAAIGAVVGGVSGGLAGKGVAETFDPTVEDAYWRQNYASRPYAKGRTYDDLQPAYKYGYESAARHQGKSFDSTSHDLEHGWDHARGASHLAWHDAKDAVRDGWHRVESGVTGNPSHRTDTPR